MRLHWDCECDFTLVDKYRLFIYVYSIMCIQLMRFYLVEIHLADVRSVLTDSLETTYNSIENPTRKQTICSSRKKWLLFVFGVLDNFGHLVHFERFFEGESGLM